MSEVLSRNIPLVLGQSAFLIIDVQNFSCTPEGGEFTGKSPMRILASVNTYSGRDRRSLRMWEVQMN